MGDGIVGTERQLDQEDDVQQGTATGDDPGASYQQHTQPLPHDGGVVQRVTDGHVPVICHHCQKKIINATKKYTKIQLRNTPWVGNEEVMSLHVHQHLWDSDR